MNETGKIKVTPEEVAEMQMRLAGTGEVVLLAGAGTSDESPSEGISVVEMMAAEGPGPEELLSESERARLGYKLYEFGETLTGRDAEIFRKRMIAEDPLTLQELATEFGVSRQRMAQLEAGLRKKLEAFAEEEGIEENPRRRVRRSKPKRRSKRKYYSEEVRRRRRARRSRRNPTWRPGWGRERGYVNEPDTAFSDEEIAAAAVHLAHDAFADADAWERTKQPAGHKVGLRRGWHVSEGEIDALAHQVGYGRDPREVRRLIRQIADAETAKLTGVTPNTTYKSHGRCSRCAGVWHPTTGAIYGKRTKVCGPCEREFWQWAQKHTAQGKRIGSRKVKPARFVYSYEHIGRSPKANRGSWSHDTELASALYGLKRARARLAG
jgi:predicted DNA-binding protein YlxM (UPF0122 family)